MLSNHREKMHMRKMSNKKSQLDAKPNFYFPLDQYILFSSFWHTNFVHLKNYPSNGFNCAVDCRLSK